MRDNIFTYEEPRGELVEIFYNLLLSGKVVSYEDVLIGYDGGKLSSPNVTGHDLYKTLKHVVPEVVDTLQKYGYDVLPVQKGRTTGYQYVGADTDPLGNIRLKALLVDRYEILSSCIKCKSPVRICYKPFNRREMEIIFHPHLLKEFNGRLFVLGVSEKLGKEPMRKFVLALDRIVGEIRSARSLYPYVPSLPGEYSYLANIVGISLEVGGELCTVRLRAFDAYTFGRLVTKPIHNSQKTISNPDPINGIEYGDVEIRVIPNEELVGQILSYGSNVVVLSPENVKSRVSDELNKALDMYSNGSRDQEPMILREC